MEKNFSSFQIAMLIKEIYASSINIISHSLKDCELTHQQIMVIQLVAHQKQITISRLCEEMSLAKATVSGIVQRLEKMDYVKRIKDTNDKRNTYVVFSDKGSIFAKEFKATINESFDRIFIGFDDEELLELRDNLLKVNRKIKESEHKWIGN